MKEANNLKTRGRLRDSDVRGVAALILSPQLIQ